MGWWKYQLTSPDGLETWAQWPLSLTLPALDASSKTWCGTKKCTVEGICEFRLACDRRHNGGVVENCLVCKGPRDQLNAGLRYPKMNHMLKEIFIVM